VFNLYTVCNGIKGRWFDHQKKPSHRCHRRCEGLSDVRFRRATFASAHRLLFRYYGPENLAGFSSLGPAFDGRMKPDIVAPGANIMSANSDANM
jgi:hypothetical protein